MYILRWPALPPSQHLLNTRKTCEICSKLTIKTPEGRYWLWTYFTTFSSVSIVGFEQADFALPIQTFYSMLHVMSTYHFSLHLHKKWSFALKVHQCRSGTLPTFLCLHKNNMPKVSHSNIFYFLRFAHRRYVTRLITNIHRQ